MSASEKTDKIQSLLAKEGIDAKILVFSQSTKTSQDAANQAHCLLGQIAKSIIFKAGDEPVLAIMSGSNRVSTRKIEQLIGIKPEKADAQFVLGKTGFPIGGVPAFGHDTLIKFIFMDQDLMQYKTIWSAAGTPHAIFEITPQNLMRMSNAQIADIKE